MEHLNRIELRGVVGTVRLQTVEGKKVARITLVTNRAYRGREGEPVIESTWHNISAWENKETTGLENIQRGDKLWVTGRVRNQHYTGSDGVERYSSDITAYKVQPIPRDEQLAYEI